MKAYEIQNKTGIDALALVERPEPRSSIDHDTSEGGRSRRRHFLPRLDRRFDNETNHEI